MALIKPMKALRYTEKAGDIKNNVCPPYDIVSPEEREALVKKSRYNFIRTELPAGGDDRYEKVGSLLNEWIDDGILKQDEKEGIFIYSEEFFADNKNYCFTGLICNVKAEPFEKKIVLPHEETLKKAKEDRFNLMKATFCNLSSVYSLYSDEEKTVKKITDKYTCLNPEVCFTDEENVTHRLWKIENKDDIQALEDFFENKQLFIADGHHRYETALRFKDYATQIGENENGECDYLMMTLVEIDDPGLVIFPTHRIVGGMKIDFDKFFEDCKDNFEIKDYDDLSGMKENLAQCLPDCAFAFYNGGKGYKLLKAKPKTKEIFLEGKSKAYSSLDVSILHSLILEPLLGIDKVNTANQINLKYTKNADEAVKSVDSGESVCAFIINPTRIHQIKDVALNGEKMPQKSTYFYPKLKTGLVINKLK